MLETNFLPVIQICTFDCEFHLKMTAKRKSFPFVFRKNVVLKKLELFLTVQVSRKHSCSRKSVKYDRCQGYKIERERFLI